MDAIFRFIRRGASPHLNNPATFPTSTLWYPSTATNPCDTTEAGCRRRLVARSSTTHARIPLAKRDFKTGQPSQLNYQGYCFPAGLHCKCLLVRMRCRLRQGEYERLIWQWFCLSLVGLRMYRGRFNLWGTVVSLITGLDQYG